MLPLKVKLLELTPFATAQEIGQAFVATLPVELQQWYADFLFSLIGWLQNCSPAILEFFAQAFLAGQQNRCQTQISQRQGGGIEPLHVSMPHELKSCPSTSPTHPGWIDNFFFSADI